MKHARTFQVRLRLEEDASAGLNAMAKLLSRVERALFSRIQAEPETAMAAHKRSFLTRFGITARHFNSCRVAVEGKIRSLKEIQKQRIEATRDCLDHCQKRLTSKKLKRASKFHLQRRQQRLQSRLNQLEADQQQGRLRLCFGSKKLFRAQHHLAESGLNSHQEWKAHWQSMRDQSFFLMGSKDETAGNQSCVCTLEEDGSVSLRVRLPDAIGRGKYLKLHRIRLPYGHEILLAALRENTARKQLYREGDGSYRERGTAISYRFVRDHKSWRLFVTVDQKPAPIKTDARLGHIGVDLNIDHLALTEIDRSGNPITSTRVSLCLYGKTTAQAKALIGDAIKQVVQHAASLGKPLVIEKLNFCAKKRSLRSSRPAIARMLSSFAYTRTLEAMQSRAVQEGVEVITVNPAYTSQIGRIKFAKQYGLTIHQAAALCIARRAAGFCETLPRQADIPTGRGGHLAFAVPVRKRHCSQWLHLKEVSKRLQAALAEHTRMTTCQSVGPPVPT